METHKMVNAELLEYTESEIEDFLNDIYGQIDVCGYKYDAGHLLKLVDPVAFRCVESEMPERWICSDCAKVHDEEDDARECCAEEED